MFNRLYLTPIALAGTLLGASVAAFAQTPAPPTPQAIGAPGPMVGHGHRHHHGGMRSALAKLDLTPDQRTKIEGLVRADRAAFRASLPAQATPAPQAREAFHAKIRADVESVLTPDQKTRFEAMPAGHERPTGAADERPIAH